MAGVTQSTVSVVLAGKSRERAISRETTEQVLRAAEALGYRPDISAQRMRGLNSRLLGVHTYGDLFPISPYNYNHEYLLGIQLAAQEAGYDLVLFTSSTHKADQPTAYPDSGNRLAAADGAVIMGFRHDHDELTRLAKDGYPFVRIGRREIPDGTSISWVDADHTTGTAELIQGLVDAGYSGLLYLGGVRNIGESWLDRRAGVARAAEMGVPGAAETPIAVLERHDVTPDWLRAMMSAGARTIIAEHHQFAVRAAQAATDLGLHLSGDLSIAVLQAPFTDVTESGYCGYLIEPRLEIGRAAAELTMDLISGNAHAGAHRRLATTPFISQRRV
jgi:DNA-binding LacI/PurR family transcriptional regulator